VRQHGRVKVSNKAKEKFNTIFIDIMTSIINIILANKIKNLLALFDIGFNLSICLRYLIILIMIYNYSKI
jgi:hypothetical protein